MRRAILCFLQKDNNVLLLHTQYPDKLVWNGVSGFIDKGETNVQAAQREIKEELGIDVEIGDMEYLRTHEIFDVFRIETWSGDPQSQESSIKEVKWFNIDELPYEEMHPGNEQWLPSMLTP